MAGLTRRRARPRRRADGAPSGLDILQDLHIAMSQENERLLAFAARVLDAQQAPPLLDSSTDVLSAPYPASRWHLTAPTPAGVLRKGTKRKIKADSLATRSQLRRYFIQLLLHRRAVEKMLELGEIQIPGHREALIV